MALPAEFDQACVHSKYVNLDGTVPVGNVKFTGGILLRATTSDTIILPSTFTVTLSGAGEFTVNLPTTDDPDITPFDWLYQVEEEFNTFNRTYYIEVPYDTVGCIEVADLEIPVGGNVAIERGRYVESIAGQVGEVTLAMMATGTANNTTFLRGDGVWAVPAGGGGGGVTAHSALTGLTTGNDHPQYVLASTKAVANGVASLGASATVPVAQLGSGSAGASVFLRGDGIWATPPSGSGTTAHSALTGLGADDHPQYHNDARGDARYVLTSSKGAANGVASLSSTGVIPDAQLGRGVASGTASLDTTARVPRAQLGSGTADSTVFLRGDGVWATATGGGGGVTAHSALTGLTADDHPQYYNSTRGDARYVQLTQRGVASGVADTDSTNHVPTARLGTGTANNTVFLRGDGAWAAPSAASGVTSVSTDGVNALTGAVNLATWFATLAHFHAASDITSGLLSIARAPAGSIFIIDKSKGGFGATAGNWPTSRPSSRTDITFFWKGNTDPAGLGPIAGDLWMVMP